MLNNAAVDKLKDTIDRLANAGDKQMLLGAVEDISKVIATQALMIQTLNVQLVFANANMNAIYQIVDTNAVNDLIAGLNSPRQNSFSMKDAIDASEQLVEKTKQANDFSQILKAVVQVGTVFL